MKLSLNARCIPAGAPLLEEEVEDDADEDDADADAVALEVIWLELEAAGAPLLEEEVEESPDDLEAVVLEATVVLAKASVPVGTGLPEAAAAWMP
ncbi:MAG: hypothetical protein ACYCTL_08740 [Acidimicrobiales bacterium]